MVYCPLLGDPPVWLRRGKCLQDPITFLCLSNLTIMSVPSNKCFVFGCLSICADSEDEWSGPGFKWSGPESCLSVSDSNQTFIFSASKSVQFWLLMPVVDLLSDLSKFVTILTKLSISFVSPVWLRLSRLPVCSTVRCLFCTRVYFPQNLWNPYIHGHEIPCMLTC